MLFCCNCGDQRNTDDDFDFSDVLTSSTTPMETARIAAVRFGRAPLLYCQQNQTDPGTLSWPSAFTWKALDQDSYLMEYPRASIQAENGRLKVSIPCWYAAFA